MGKKISRYTAQKKYKVKNKENMHPRNNMKEKLVS